MRNIVITGFMASGKTTVSRLLMEKTSLKLIDTDEIIEEREGKSINEIFETYGEGYFRKKENELSRELKGTHDAIISTGGGFVLNPDNMANIRKNGIIFLLDADFDVIWSRVIKAAKTRPLMRNSTMDGLKDRFYARKRFYDDCDYKIHIDHDTTAEHIVKEILDIYDKE